MMPMLTRITLAHKIFLSKNIFGSIASNAVHTTSFSKLPKGPFRYDNYAIMEHAARGRPVTPEQHREAAMRYGMREEDYKPIYPENMEFWKGDFYWAGDYPDLGEHNFDHKDPYEDWSDPFYRRNFGEPVQIDWIINRPDRETYTGLNEDHKLKTFFKHSFIVWIVLAIVIYFLSRNWRYDITYVDPLMPKQYPYDFHRAWPWKDPRKFPITNYSFELADSADEQGEHEHH